MLFQKKPYEPSQNLKDAIDRAYLDLAKHTADSKEFADIIKHIQSLEELANPESNLEQRKRIDPNKVIAASASILGILVVISYEHAHVIASKGFGLVPKP